MNKRLKELAAQADADAEPLRFSLGGQNYQQVRDERFAELVRQDERDKCAADYLQDCCDAIAVAEHNEREACAKLCEIYSMAGNLAGLCATAIRARGEK